MDAPDPAVQRRVRVAARALGRHGLAHAYGHCSARLDAHTLLVCAPKPMALIEPSDMGSVVPIEGGLPSDVLGEVRIHQQIYRRHPAVGAVVRCMPPALMALGTAGLVPQVRHGLGAYLGGRVALWDDPQLIRDDASAAAVAEALASGHAIVLRGNGVVVAAATLLDAVVLCWYLEDAARLELTVRAAGLLAPSQVLSAAECDRRATRSGEVFERMGMYLSAGDPEGPLA